MVDFNEALTSSRIDFRPIESPKKLAPTRKSVVSTDVNRLYNLILSGGPPLLESLIQERENKLMINGKPIEETQGIMQ